MAEEIVPTGPVKRPKTMRLIRHVMDDYIDALQRKLEGEKHYLESGFKSLDRFLPAWLHDGHLIIVAGRPGMGKSIFAQQLAEGVAEGGHSSLEITLEMSSYELVERSICRRTGVPISALKTGDGFQDSDWPKISGAHERMLSLPFLIDDASFDIGPLIHKVKAAAAGMAAAGLPPLKCLVVDYLQLIGASGANRNLEITQITGALKRLAKELQIPVVALSQLNRSVEGRADKRPMMSDLRESGAIEQDADLILFLYRDEYYTKEACTEPGIAEVISAKNRHGPTGMIKMAFVGERMMFADIATDHQPDEGIPGRDPRLVQRKPGQQLEKW